MRPKRDVSEHALVRHGAAGATGGRRKNAMTVVRNPSKAKVSCVLQSLSAFRLGPPRQAPFRRCGGDRGRCGHLWNRRTAHRESRGKYSSSAANHYVRTALIGTVVCAALLACEDAAKVDGQENTGATVATVAGDPAGTIDGAQATAAAAPNSTAARLGAPRQWRIGPRRRSARSRNGGYITRIGSRRGASRPGAALSARREGRTIEGQHDRQAPGKRADRILSRPTTRSAAEFRGASAGGRGGSVPDRGTMDEGPDPRVHVRVVWFDGGRSRRGGAGVDSLYGTLLRAGGEKANALASIRRP